MVAPNLDICSDTKETLRFNLNHDFSPFPFPDVATSMTTPSMTLDGAVLEKDIFHSELAATYDLSTGDYGWMEQKPKSGANPSTFVTSLDIFLEQIAYVNNQSSLEHAVNAGVNVAWRMNGYLGRMRVRERVLKHRHYCLQVIKKAIDDQAKGAPVIPFADAIASVAKSCKDDGEVGQYVLSASSKVLQFFRPWAKEF